jgi:hypothetical protein
MATITDREHTGRALPSLPCKKVASMSMSMSMSMKA